MALQPPIELTDVLPPPNHDDVQVNYSKGKFNLNIF